MPAFITGYQDGITDWSAATMNTPLLLLDKYTGVHHNIIVSCDGNITYNKSTGALAWSDVIRVFFINSSGQSVSNTVAAGSQVLADGQFLYMDLNETNGTAIILGVAAISLGVAANFASTYRLVLGYRNAASDNFYPVALKTAFGASGKQSKYDATTAPTTSNDASQGYEVGSIWIDVTNDRVYACVDSTTSAAIWKQLSPPILNKFDATADPTTTNDSSQGYAVGSLWVNVTGDKSFIAVDVTVSAAIWNRIDGGGAATDITVTTTNFNKNLSAADNTVQKALETLDDMVAGGGGGGQFSIDTYEYTAGTSQTVFTGADDNAATLDLDGRSAVVIVNGVTLSPDEYTTTSTTVTLDVAAPNGADVTIWALGAGSDVLNKADATVAPTGTNDNTEGYTVGSRWSDITNDKVYFCIDATTSNAVWIDVSKGGHVIQDNGTNKTQRSNLNFVGFDVTDDSGNDATVISAPTNLSGIVDVPEVAAKASFTPTVNNWTACTWTGYRWRIGNMLYMHIRGSVTGAPTGTVELVLPDSLALDTSIISVGEIPVFGEGFALDNGTGWKHFVCRIASGSPTKVLFIERGNGALSAFNATTPFTWANTDSLSFMLAVPISGWNTSKSINVGRIPAMYSAIATRTTNQTLSAGSTVVQFTTENLDEKDMINLGADNTLITIPAGCDRAIFSANVQVDNTADGQPIGLQIYRVSDLHQVAYDYIPAGGTQAWRKSISSTVQIVVPGQTYRLTCVADTTRTLTKATFSCLAWNSQSPRASAFKGALVKRITSDFAINPTTYTPIDFNDEAYDTDNFHDNSTNPSRLTIPTGVSKVRLAGNVMLAATAGTSTTILTMYKNGLTFAGQPQARLSQIDSDCAINISSGVLDVSAGDYFTLTLYQNHGYDVRADVRTWFSIEVIE